MINKTQDEIIKEWQKIETNKPLVSICCLTYNHELYIEQALDGFLRQNTSFPFEVIINDDASTDRTTEIIRKYELNYPLIVKPIYHEVNEYSQGIDVFDNLVKKAKGKYLAICEGDDYWIDENKLQMQVGFLENNSDYGLCYTKSYVFNQLKNINSGVLGSGKTEFKDILLNYDIPTATVVLRKNLYDMYIVFREKYSQKWIVGDYPMSLWFSINSIIKYFPYETAVYRVLNTSASHFNDFEKEESFKLSIYNNIQLLYINMFCNSVKEKDYLTKKAANEVNRYLCKKAFIYGIYNKSHEYAKKTKNENIKDIFLKTICSNSIVFIIFRFIYNNFKHK